MEQRVVDTGIIGSGAGAAAARDPRQRTWGQAFRVHLRVRFVHAMRTWLYTKPLLLRNLNKVYERPFPTHPAPDFGPVRYFLIKVQWYIAAFFQQKPILTVPYVAFGLFHLNHFFFGLLERSLLRDLQKKGPPRSVADRMLPIPEFDWRNESPETFIKEFVRKPFPVVLRGFSLESPATQVFQFNRLLEAYGDETVLLTTREKDGFEGKLSMVRDPKVYCHNSEFLFMKHPKLKDVLGFDRLVPYSDGKREAYSQLFIGRRGTGSPLHCAAIWNWFHMLDGRKRWYFINPNDSLHLYPVNSMGQVAATAHCSFPDRYNKDAYPLFQYCPYYSVELDPGDVLLVPPWWWHAIDNLTDESTAVASRWHLDGVVGKAGMWTEEDYDVSRFLSTLLQIGFASPFHMQQILMHPSPKVDEHVTLREKKNRFVDKHYRLASGKVLGIYHKI